MVRSLNTMVKKNDIELLNKEIDRDKRETLAKLAKAAWAVPVVATFGLGALSLKSTTVHALIGNGFTLS